MSEDNAKLIFIGIMSVGICVWALSLIKALRMGRPAKQVDSFDLDEAAEPGELETQSGTVTLRGEPETLSKALLRSLTQLHFGMLSSVFKIEQRSDGRILLTKTGSLVCNLPPGLYFNEADIAFERAGFDTVDVNYRISYERSARRLRMIALAVILGLGLPALCIMGAVIWLFVVPSQNPAVRWQVVQTVHIVHFLWPPFLCFWMYSLGRRQSKTLIENVVTSLAQA